MTIINRRSNSKKLFLRGSGLISLCLGTLLPDANKSSIRTLAFLSKTKTCCLYPDVRKGSRFPNSVMSNSFANNVELFATSSGS